MILYTEVTVHITDVDLFGVHIVLNVNVKFKNWCYAFTLETNKQLKSCTACKI